MCVCKGHPGGRKVQVQFVDFGNIKIMSVSDVKKVKNEFLALPAMVRTNPHSTGQSYESCFCVCLSLSTEFRLFELSLLFRPSTAVCRT